MSVFRQRSARIGWQVQPEFVVVQSAHSVRVLEELQHYFGCGRVGSYARTDNHRGPMARWAVRSRRELTDRIVPFFEETHCVRKKLVSSSGLRVWSSSCPLAVI